MEKSAVISECGSYRYSLWRRWDKTLPYMSFVMLNPSVADADLDDPTIRRCIGFAKREGVGGLIVRNLFAFRATKPADLLQARDPEGPEIARYLTNIIQAARDGTTKIVCAWGTHNAIKGQDRRFRYAAISENAPLFCLRKTRSGAPMHPLYIPANQPLEFWP